MTIYCKICGNHTVSNWGEVCWRCQNRQREAHEATLRQAGAAEDAAEYQRQAAAAAEEAAYDAAEARRLAAEVHYNCYHCGGSFAKSTGYGPSETEIGKPLCSDCYDLVKKCYGCKKIIFKGSSDCVKLKTIYHRKKETREIIPHDEFYACRDCSNNNLGKEQKWFDIQEKRKKEYEEQERARKNQEKIENEKKAAQKRKQDAINRELAEEARQESIKQYYKNQRKEAALIALPFFLVSLCVVGFFTDISWKTIGIIALFLCVGCVALKSVFGWLGRIYLLGLIYTIAIGIIASVVCWFAIDAFITPLLVCFGISMIVSAILEIAGITKNIGNDVIKSVFNQN